MKKVIFFLFMVLLSANLINAQIEMNSNGNVGIGTSPSSSYKLYTPSTSQNCFGRVYISYSSYSPALQLSANTVAPCLSISGSSSTGYLLAVGGAAYASGSWEVSSDRKLKKNIKDLDGAKMLKRLTNINGKSYEFKSKEELKDVYKNNKHDSTYTVPNFKDGKQYGLIAQELEGVFPELVSTDSTTNLKAINYDGMIPILLQAIKEQQAQIEAQDKKIETLESCCSNGTYKSKSKSSTINEEAIEAVLYQNEPNPFTENTVIKFSLPESVENAFIGIYNLNGTQLKSIAVTARGESSITLAASELQAGMYFYSLIADGKEVDTKRMVITE